MASHHGNTENNQNGSQWRYNEEEIIDQIYEYCLETYNEHYGQNDLQASEFISSSGHGSGFFIGNIIKYADRYGKKGGYNRRDLLKIAHYCIMQIWEHDKNGR